MPASPHVTVRINLARIRANARCIKANTGVAVLAMVKADAYGVGAARVVQAIGNDVDGFCVFSIQEAIAAKIWETTGKSTLCLGPDLGISADAFIGAHARPAVWDIDRAAALRAARPVLSIDTGMQRFACPPEEIKNVLHAGACDEAFTHATTLDRVERLRELAGGRGLRLHAAGSSLLHQPRALLDAVRPGLALYRQAARVSVPLVQEKKSTGPAGYSGFIALRHGVIQAGYSHGLRIGPCTINGRKSRILEVGMQTSFIETADGDRVGDEVILLGEGLTEDDIAPDWNCSPHAVLTHLCGAGRRTYDEK